MTQQKVSFALCNSIQDVLKDNNISIEQLEAFLELHNSLCGISFKCGATGWDSEVDSIEDYFETEEAVDAIATDMEERAKDWLDMDECIIENLNKYGLQFNEDMLEELLEVYGFEVSVKPFKYC